MGLRTLIFLVLAILTALVSVAAYFSISLIQRGILLLFPQALASTTMSTLLLLLGDALAGGLQPLQGLLPAGAEFERTLVGVDGL